MPFHLIHADLHLLVLEKPSGLLSVPGRGPDKQDCLSARVQAQYPDALIVHRLDMDTSGLFVMARGPEAQRRLSMAFAARQVKKRYIALVAGHLPAPDTPDGWGLIDLPLIVDWPNRPRSIVDHEIGKPSQTRWRVLHSDAASTCENRPSPPATLWASGPSLAPLETATPLRPAPCGLVPLAGEGSELPSGRTIPSVPPPQAGEAPKLEPSPASGGGQGGGKPFPTTRLELDPLTGRSHQLRVHLQALGHPILGDPLYAPPAVLTAAGRLLLHASRLDFAHPVTGADLHFESPPDF
ncbi:MAG: RluA family pseudouridine synthase [Pseudomonadota bacterium]